MWVTSRPPMLRGRRDHARLDRGRRRCSRPRFGLDDSERLELAGLDQEGRRDPKAGRKLADVHADRSFEAVQSFGRDLEFLGASGIDPGICAGQCDLEIGALRTNRQRIAVIRTAEAAHVLELDQIFAVGRRGKVQSRVFAELAMGIVVVLVVNRKHRQAIGDELCTWRMRLNDVTRFPERMGQRRRVKITPAQTAARIANESGIRPARI